MVINLEAWRSDGLEDCCLEAARRLRYQSRWIDQDAVNACLKGKWGPLPPMWNKQFALDLFPDWRSSPHTEEEFLQARSDPAIIHFSNRTKPWHAFCDHPRPDILAFRDKLRGSAFDSGLERRPSHRERIAEFFASPHRRVLDRAATARRAIHRAHALKAMLPGIVKLALTHPWTLVTVPVSVVSQQAAMRLGR